MENDTWRKSTYSGSQANCIEVGHSAGTVIIRDTKDRQGARLEVPGVVWSAFIAGLK